MSWRATAWARETQKHRTVGEKFLLLVLADYADAESCIAWPSQSKLAEICMMTDRSIRSALTRLENNGYITRLNKGNQYRKSQYFLHIDNILAPEIISASSEPEKSSGAQVNRKTEASEPENGDIAYKGILTVIEPSTKNKSSSATSQTKPKRAKRVTEIDESFREKMRGRFGPVLGDTVDERIDEALGHKAANKSTDHQAYVTGWLRRDSERMLVNNNRSNNAQPRNADLDAFARYSR